MKKIIISVLAIALVLSMATFVFANDNLRVEKKADIENLVSTETSKVVEEVEEVEEEIVEEVEEAANMNTLIAPNPSLIAPNESLIATDEEETLDIATNFEKGDFFVADDNVEIGAVVVDGNAFLCGDNINVDSLVVHGDVFIAGQNVVINKIVADNAIFLACQNGKLKNVRANDLYSVGVNLEVSDESQVLRSMYSAAQKLLLEKTMINRNLLFTGENIEIKEGSAVDGVFSYSSTNDAVISEDSTVPNVEKNLIDKAEIEIEEQKTVAQIFVQYLVDFVGMILVVTLMLLLLSKVEGTEKYSKPVGRLILELVLGVLGGVALIILGVAILIFTGAVTYRLVLTIWVLYLVAFLFAGVATALSFARAISKSLDGKKVFWLAFAIYTVYSIVRLIPGAYLYVSAIFLAFGLGHLTISFFEILKRPFSKEGTKVAVEKRETPAVEPEIVEHVVDEVVEDVKEEIKEDTEKEEE